MTNVQIRLYDAFATQLRGGNVAGIVYCEPSPLPDVVMQQIAAELAAPTTGFIREVEGGWELRFMTPTQEIDMCGHVTVAAFTSLADEGRLPGKNRVSTTAFTKAGEIPIEVTRGEARPVVQLRQLPPRFRDAGVSKAGLAVLLGISEAELHATLPLQIVSTGLSHLVVPVAHADVLSVLWPKGDPLAELSKRLMVDTIPVVAFTGLDSAIVARCRDLCPGIGNFEEPASGTTNGALACYMASHGLRGADQRIALAEQGVEMGRPSIIESELDFGPNGEVVGVSVRGQALLSMTGILHLAAN